MTGHGRHVLICGASFAGLATAFWMKKLGYDVTVVEIAGGLRTGGTPVNIEGNTIGIMKRMGLFDQVRSNRLATSVMELVESGNRTETSISLEKNGLAEDEYEIERDLLLNLMFEAVEGDVEFVFGERLTFLKEERNGIHVAFDSGRTRFVDLVFGCDGSHSAVRRFCFGDEKRFSHFLNAYFSITIVNRSLIRENTMRLYNEPGKAIILKAYNNKTDIVLCFASEKEIAYDYRDEQQQRNMILDQFSGSAWRTAELLDAVKRSKTFYFDKLCQIRMPSWTKGRVALVGDAGYCASPAAGKGGSLAIDGAAALADAFQECNGGFEAAFRTYNDGFHPFIEDVQADAVAFGVDFLVPGTAEAIRARNARARFG